MNDECKYKLSAPLSAGEGDDLLKGKSVEDGQRRLQALLADWLRMENLVVLTAAGTSVGAGGRLMAGPPANNLESLVLEAVEQCAIPADAKAIIAAKKTKGAGNFEDWLSYLFSAPGIVSAKDSPLHSLMWNEAALPSVRPNPIALTTAGETALRSFIERAIFAECALEIDLEEITTVSKKESSGHIPFLAKLISRDTNLGRTHLFTLNYDTLFEQAMEELGIQYFDGFTGKANSRFDPAVYGLDIYYPGDVAEGRVRRFDKFLQYYKLHGSIHWSVDADGIYRARHVAFDFLQKYRDKTPAEKATLLESPAFAAIKPFGILPTSQKFTKTLDMPYAHLFRLFHARLNQPQTFLIVCGYGFGDNHVSRIIETALTNPSLVMLVVEPNPDSEIVKRIQKYQGLGQRAFVLTERLDPGAKCTFTKATFSDFAQNVMPDVKWLDDYKRLRAFEDQLRKTDDKSPPPLTALSGVTQ